MALPAIDSLATTFPLAHIHAFTGRHSAPVFRATEHISQVYLAPDQLTPARLPGMSWNLRTAGHDWVVVLDRSRLLLTAARAASPGTLVTLETVKNEQRHEIDVYLDAVIAAGGREVSKTPRLDPGDKAIATARKALQTVDGPFAVLHPGGAENPGSVMLDKRWPVERYAEVAIELARRGFTPLLTGGPGDVQSCIDVARLAGHTNCLNLAGALDLLSTAAVIQQADLYVGTDTGVSHLAAAVGTPSVVIFGPTNPRRYGPRGKHVTILAPDASHALHDVDLRRAASARNRPTTNDISAEAVLEAIERLPGTPAAN